MAKKERSLIERKILAMEKYFGLHFEEAEGNYGRDEYVSTTDGYMQDIQEKLWPNRRRRWWRRY